MPTNSRLLGYIVRCHLSGAAGCSPCSLAYTVSGTAPDQRHADQRAGEGSWAGTAGRRIFRAGVVIPAVMGALSVRNWFNVMASAVPHSRCPATSAAWRDRRSWEAGGNAPTLGASPW